MYTLSLEVNDIATGMIFSEIHLAVIIDPISLSSTIFKIHHSKYISTPFRLQICFTWDKIAGNCPHCEDDKKELKLELNIFCE